MSIKPFQGSFFLNEKKKCDKNRWFGEMFWKKNMKIEFDI